MKPPNPRALKKMQEARAAYEKELAEASAEHIKNREAAWERYKAAGNKYGNWRMK